MASARHSVLAVVIYAYNKYKIENCYGLAIEIFLKVSATVVLAEKYTDRLRKDDRTDASHILRPQFIVPTRTSFLLGEQAWVWC